MKIVCDSCGAKYSIADEKVAGRVFKIRCKKCGAAIVVRGDQSASQESAAAGAAPAGGFDYGSDAVWHVVVDGEQQGPFSPAQLGQMISANTIAWDAYVWREGYDDWKPAQDVEELVQAIMNPGGGAGAPAAAAPAGGDDPFAESTVAGAPLPSSDAGADLFAQSESASPFGGGGSSPFGGGGDEDDVVASAPSPRVSASQAMTGARNENSVLFSLSNLQALATGGSSSSSSSSSSASKPSTPAAKPGMASGEGSGLIDIRALASATGIGGAGGGVGSAPAAPARVDDLLSIGTATPGLGSALGAPVIIPEKKEESSSKGLVIGMSILGVCILGAAAAIAVVLMNQPDPATIAAADTAAAGALAPGAAAAPGAVPAPGAPGVAALPDSASATAAAAAVAPAAGGTAAAGTEAAAPAAAGGTAGAAASDDDDRGGSGSRRRRGGGGGGAAASESGGGGGGGSSSSASASASSSSSSSRSGGSGGGGGSSSIDDLLAGALGGSGGGGGRRAASSGGGSSGGGGGSDSSLPQTPSRDDVVQAMNRVQSAVTACGGGQHGTAMVAISVAGSTGRVTNATVSGQFAGTPVGSCIARAVRGATFPRFQRATFTINYPFRI